ncbi:MAG: RNA polymerase sigma factor RpoH [Betaproteobacteria bacterium]|nr:RNA polymerase sigma factor RpoH [Betaproteobacteria bacterium]MBA3776274.1 RNA polymerase sigma factor RpoH [Betaproteobacteria bacterium]
MTSTTLALTFPTPASLGSLDHYIQAVNRFPLLSAEEETALGRRLVQGDDLDAARALVLSHLRLVVSVSRNYTGYGLPQADLIQEGNVGLMKAVRRFDPERGVRLVSFALHWIRAEMHEYILRNWRLVKIATTKAQRKLFFNLRSMKAGSGALSVAEAKAIAKDLGVKPEEVVEMETRLTGRDVSIDPTPGDEENSVSPIAYLTESDDEPAKIYERKEFALRRSEGLHQVLAKLDDRSRRIIEARWLREDDSATLQDLATEYGVSAERIRQIESKAMKAMRTQLAHAA